RQVEHARSSSTRCTLRRTRDAVRPRRSAQWMWRQNWATQPNQRRRVVEHSSTCSLRALDCAYIMARSRRGARVESLWRAKSGSFAGTILLDRLCFDVALIPGNRFELSASEQFGLVAIVWR